MVHYSSYILNTELKVCYLVALSDLNNTLFVGYSDTLNKYAETRKHAS